MGHRAHYVIKSGGRWETHYSQWGGYSIELDLLAGPEAALRFSGGQKVVTRWMNEMECDGAAIVDLDERRLLWFGRFLDDAAYRAAAFETMARTWRGWRIDWAYNGLREILDVLGEDTGQIARWRTIPVGDDIRTPEKFMAAMPQFHLSPEIYPPGSELPGELPLRAPCPDPAPAGHEHVCLVTVVKGDVTRAYMVDAGAAWVIETGVGSVSTRYDTWEPVTEWPFFPSSGVHLDVDRQSGGVWTFGTLDDVLGEAGTFWPGWRWEFWQDRHGEHLDRIGDVIALPRIDRLAGLRKLAGEFDAHQDLDAGTRSASALLGVVGALRAAAESQGLAARAETDNAMTHRPTELTTGELAHVHAVLAALIGEAAQ